MKKNNSAPKKKPGVLYAQTVSGVELPIIDITNPNFIAPEPGEADIAAALEKVAAEQKSFRRLPPLLGKFLIWFFTRKSALVRGMMGAKTTYLSGMNTYLLKLGPDNLEGEFDNLIDRNAASSLGALLMRLRMQDLVRMTVDAVAPELQQRPGKPLHLINIAGGPCPDTLNFLIMLCKEKPGLLEGRAVRIHVFDLEDAAPTFATRAIEALKAPGAALEGVDAALEYIPYDWRETRRLHDHLAALDMSQSIAVVFTEGGLFDYGAQEEIIANLKVLHALTPAGTVLTGTSTPKDKPDRVFTHKGGAITIQRTLSEFTDIVGRSGWSVAQSEDRMINYIVRLTKVKK